MQRPHWNPNRTRRAARRRLATLPSIVGLGLVPFLLVLRPPQDSSITASESAATIIHVAADGNDAWAGRLERPDMDVGDGPV
ncbi:MAG: hypothetical protein GYA33_10615, partial [Thermogutta sp.]|nr:hypothetical protein [Thermogutta sp.]